MKLLFDYVDHMGAPFDAEALEALAEKTLLASRAATTVKEKTIALACAVVTDEQMQETNLAVRGKDDTTDVLSIGAYSDDKDILLEGEKNIDLGELLLSWEDIQNNATIQQTDPRYEFAYVFTHGILHLLGYTHGQEMFDAQHELSQEFLTSLS